MAIKITVKIARLFHCPAIFAIVDYFFPSSAVYLTLHLKSLEKMKKNLSIIILEPKIFTMHCGYELLGKKIASSISRFDAGTNA